MGLVLLLLLLLGEEGLGELGGEELGEEVEGLVVVALLLLPLLRVLFRWVGWWCHWCRCRPDGLGCQGCGLRRGARCAEREWGGAGLGWRRWLQLGCCAHGRRGGCQRPFVRVGVGVGLGNRGGGARLAAEWVLRECRAANGVRDARGGCR